MGVRLDDGDIRGRHSLDSGRLPERERPDLRKARPGGGGQPRHRAVVHAAGQPGAGQFAVAGDLPFLLADIPAVLGFGRDFVLVIKTQSRQLRERFA